jgi:hypothetical protein
MSSTYTFEGQLPSEDVLLITKQHPFILLKPALISSGILLMPFALYVFMPINSFILYSLLICVIVAPFNMYVAWYAWYHSMFILTNRRILLQTQKGLTRKEMAGSGLEKIHRVTHHINGLLRTLGGYGTVTILTDDSQTALVLHDVDQPFAIQQEILQVMMGELLSD